MRLTLLAALLLAACSSTSEVAPETHGPLAAGALGRQAFRSANGQLLARDAGDAEAAAQLLATVAADFRERTGREPSARLLVLAGAGGWGSSDEERFLIGVRAQTALDGQPPLSPHEEASQLADFQKNCEESHIPPAVMLTLRPTPLQPAQLAELGLPLELTGPVDWGVVIATPDETEDAVDVSLDAALESDDIGFGQRLLIMPFLPFVSGKMEDVMEAAAKSVVFATHASVQPDWDAARRKLEVANYLAALEGRIQKEMQSAEKGNPVRVDT